MMPETDEELDKKITSLGALFVKAIRLLIESIVREATDRGPSTVKDDTKSTAPVLGFPTQGELNLTGRVFRGPEIEKPPDDKRVSDLDWLVSLPGPMPPEEDPLPPGVMPSATTPSAIELTSRAPPTTPASVSGGFSSIEPPKPLATMAEPTAIAKDLRSEFTTLIPPERDPPPYQFAEVPPAPSGASVQVTPPPPPVIQLPASPPPRLPNVPSQFSTIQPPNGMQYVADRVEPPPSVQSTFPDQKAPAPLSPRVDVLPEPPPSVQSTFPDQKAPAPLSPRVDVLPEPPSAPVFALPPLQPPAAIPLGAETPIAFSPSLVLPTTVTSAVPHAESSPAHEPGTDLRLPLIQAPGPPVVQITEQQYPAPLSPISIPIAAEMQSPPPLQPPHASLPPPTIDLPPRPQPTTPLEVVHEFSILEPPRLDEPVTEESRIEPVPFVHPVETTTPQLEAPTFPYRIPDVGQSVWVSPEFRGQLPDPRQIVPPILPPLPKSRTFQMDENETFELRRGFSPDDPTGRMNLYREQAAQAHSYDQTRDMIFEGNAEQDRSQRQYRQTMHQLQLRTLQDLNNDHRRLQDLERALECSRETITDANI